MPLTYPVAVANIMSRPKMSVEKVREDVGKVAEHARGGIVLWSEISHDYYVRAVAALDGFATYQPKGVDVPITWDTGRYTVIDVGLDFGSVGIPGIAPARHTTWALLTDVLTKDIVGVANAHMHPDGWNPKPNIVQRALRRLLWTRHEKRIQKRIEWLSHRAKRVHVGGDINRPGTYTFTSLRRSTGAGVIYLGSRGAVAQSAPDRFALNSDHDMQVVTMTPRIGASMTKPIRPPAPIYLGPAAHTTPGDNKPISRVVIHCTVSPLVEGQARATAAYFRSKSSGGSAHYVVDADEVIQVVPDSVIAWHAPPNNNSIGVELCDALASEAWDKANAKRWADVDHERMLKKAAHLVAKLCLAYEVPIQRLTVAELKAGRHGICGHVDVSQAWGQSTHWDPGPSFPWVHFLALVNDAADIIKENHR
ncbi:N-acetyl-anhydromuramyl-L-alanine amidase AmpD [Nocardioides ginsengisegetis]|uniref:N-acetylmuramoyl-L-alanine amidase n=1 Tax=Nocardioides ginsengisegetis TaxID=661491 RepID=A0A7W3J465_9ACTN|nr:peptidoglycan recognition family protein [Nocardioides ginsengisegetis]MBA8805996.1 N-acetyl-anhydromuramyl-L-alanine amidase AmpD [Nocardioides ginsengisegetis]